MTDAREALVDTVYFAEAANLGETPDSLADAYKAQVLREAADAYERDQAERYPGAIYGAIRRIRSFKVGAYLRAMADAATEEPTR